MRMASWIVAGVCAFGFASSAKAQNAGTTNSLTPGNISNALTGVKAGEIQFQKVDVQKLASSGGSPAGNVSRSRFNVLNLFSRNRGSSAGAIAPGLAPSFSPAAPIMSTVANPSQAITGLGSATANRGTSFQLPTPITGR